MSGAKGERVEIFSSSHMAVFYVLILAAENFEGDINPSG